MKPFSSSTQRSVEFHLLTKKLKNKNTLLAFKLLDIVFIVLINVNMTTIFGILTFKIVDILTFISMVNFIIIAVEHEKRFINSEPDLEAGWQLMQKSRFSPSDYQFPFCAYTLRTDRISVTFRILFRKWILVVVSN